jgi:predicted DNA-binding transcriptional regulator AlpA
MKKLNDMLSLQETLALTSLKRTTLYLYIETRNFPQQIQLGKKIYFSKTKVLQWLKLQGFDISENE